MVVKCEVCILKKLLILFTIVGIVVLNLTGCSKSDNKKTSVPFKQGYVLGFNVVLR